MNEYPKQDCGNTEVQVIQCTI